MDSLTVLNPAKNNVFPVLIPIISLFVGFMLNISLQQFQEFRRIRETKKHFLFSINHLIFGTREQNVAFKLFIEQLNEFENNIPRYAWITEFNLDNINIISRADIYKIFITKNRNKTKVKSELLAKYNTAIQNIKYISSKFGEEYNKLQQYNEQAVEKIVLSEKKALILIMNIDKSSHRSNKEFNRIVNECWINYMNDPSRFKVTVMHNKLYKPILDLAFEYQNKEWLELCNEMVQGFFHFETSRYGFISLFEFYRNELETSANILEEVLAVFNSKYSDIYRETKSEQSL